MTIFKILRAEEWDDLTARGQTAGAPVDVQDGFVHFSTAAQTAETLRRHFNGQDGLILLACDPATLGDALRWEPSRGGDLFPHLYRPLSMNDVAWHRPIALGPDGHDPGPLA